MSKHIVFLSSILVLAMNMFSQWFTTGNNAILGDFLGTLNAISLDFRTNNIQRGTILPNGFWGIGNTPFIPQSRLHLNSPLIQGIFTQWTNAATGNATLNDGLRIGVNAGAVVELRQYEVAPIRLFSNAIPNHVLRMQIGFDGINRTRVSIGLNAQPRTYLHLGGVLPVNGSGFRSWMNVGLLMSSDTLTVPPSAPDNMYVGLRQYAGDSLDAIINWGNNPSNTNG